MGAACLQCLQIFTSHNPSPSPNLNPNPNPNTEPPCQQPDTSRGLAPAATRNEEHSLSVGARGSHLQIESNISAVRETKTFGKTRSTALFSSEGDRRHSSILQFTLDQESILVMGGECSTAPAGEEFYTLISKVAFVKKTMDCIKVTSPAGQSQLHCPPQLLFSTLAVCQGWPAESMSEVGPNKLIQVSDSPIRATIRLQCKQCLRCLKMTSSKGMIMLAGVECAGCEGKQWKLLEVQSNAPVWGEGAKLEPHEQVDPAPSILRVMGCVVCLKFSNCSKMNCGCLLCSSCLAANPDLSLEMQCRMCRGSYII